MLFLEFSDYKDEDKSYFINVTQISTFDDVTINPQSPKTRIRMFNGDEMVVAQPVVRICRMIVTALESDE